MNCRQTPSPKRVPVAVGRRFNATFLKGVWVVRSTSGGGSAAAVPAARSYSINTGGQLAGCCPECRRMSDRRNRNRYARSGQAQWSPVTIARDPVWCRRSRNTGDDRLSPLQHRNGIDASVTSVPVRCGERHDGVELEVRSSSHQHTDAFKLACAPAPMVARTSLTRDYVPRRSRSDNHGPITIAGDSNAQSRAFVAYRHGVAIACRRVDAHQMKAVTKPTSGKSSPPPVSISAFRVPRYSRSYSVPRNNTVHVLSN